MRVELAVMERGGAGGIGRYVSELRKHLPADVRAIEAPLVPLHRGVPLLRSLPARVEGHQPGAIVHFTQIVGSALMLWRPLRPAMATVHDIGVLESRAERARLNVVERVLLRLSYLGLQRMDAVIAVSESTRQAVIRHLRIPPERVVTVYSGIDRQRFRPLVVDRAALFSHLGVPAQPGHRYLLYVGSEAPRKNLGTLFAALALLRTGAGPAANVHLLKVGRAGGTHLRRATLRTARELGVIDQIHFLDTVDDDELPLVYNAADVVVCPSLVEGFNFPLLEALACGRPVVASNIPVHGEIAGEAVIYAAPRSPSHFAQALGVALAPQVRSNAPSSAHTVVSAFSWEVTAEKTAERYRSVSPQ